MFIELIKSLFRSNSIPKSREILVSGSSEADRLDTIQSILVELSEKSIEVELGKICSVLSLNFKIGTHPIIFLTYLSTIAGYHLESLNDRASAVWHLTKSNLGDWREKDTSILIKDLTHKEIYDILNKSHAAPLNKT